MIVRGPAELRFEQRWQDYWQVLDHGTPKSVGTNEPQPPDRRDAIIALLKGNSPRKWESANEALDGVWARDSKAWPRRLSPFLEDLTQLAQKAFADLVKAGCQPDTLALQFHEATQVVEYKKHHDRLLADIDELDRLAARAVHALRDLANGRLRFDQYLVRYRLRVVEGEPGDAELKILLWDLEDLAARHGADNRQLRRQLD